jgi:cytochrome c-type biogenesis protein CcmH/NrfG
MFKKSLSVLIVAMFSLAAYQAVAEEKKVDSEAVEQNNMDKHSHHSHHSHPKDAKGTFQAEPEAKDVKETETKSDGSKHSHPRDGK